jgi:adenylate kinase family enzyme
MIYEDHYMKRVLVTGNAGSGKTTFTKLISKELALPAYGLDAIVWKSGWVETPKQERREKIQKLVDCETWVIDGVSSQIFHASDTVFFLDIPIHRCLLNIMRRFISNGFKTRESLPENCPEYIGFLKAIRIAFLYQRKTRPALLQLIAEYPQKKVFWVRSYRELDAIHKAVICYEANDEYVR